jgi:hypothetical protein
MDQEKYCSGEKQHGVRLYRKDGAGEIRAGKVAAGKFREVSVVMNFLMLLLVYYTQFPRNEVISPRKFSKDTP